MLAKLRNLFNSENTVTDESGDENEKQLATAALLIEAAASDDNFDDDEKTSIQDILSRYFKINAEDAASLIEAATEKQQSSDQILYFTRTIKENFEMEERIEVMEMLWEVSYADGVLTDYESNLMRRVAGLIYVSDKENGTARKNVLKRLNSSQ